jgi:hypothetical protein
MRRRVMAAALAVAMLSPGLPLAGCASRETAFVESGIPAVPGLQFAFAEGLSRRGDELVAGRFAFRGRIVDAEALMDRTLALFASQGWRLLDRERGDRRVRATLAKGNRRCEVTISPNRIDPAMSVAQLAVGEIEAPPAASP